MLLSPWHGVTTVMIGNCGFGVAPTRPEHRGVILRTLGRGRGMSLDALSARIGEGLVVRGFPEYLDAVERRVRDQRRGARRAHAAAAVRDGRECDGARATADEIARMH